MFLFSDLPTRLIIAHEVKDTSEIPPEPGSDKRDFSESEQIWKSRRIHIPKLVDVQVPGTTRVGKDWV